MTTTPNTKTIDTTESVSPLLTASSNAGRLVLGASTTPIRTVLTDEQAEDMGKALADLNGMASQVVGSVLRVAVALLVARPDRSIAGQALASTVSQAKVAAELIRRYAAVDVAGSDEKQETVQDYSHVFAVACHMAKVKGATFWGKQNTDRVAAFMADNVDSTRGQVTENVKVTFGDGTAPTITEDGEQVTDPAAPRDENTDAEYAANEGTWETANRAVETLEKVWKHLTSDERDTLALVLARITDEG